MLYKSKQLTTKNWIGLTVVRAVNNTLQLHENVVQNYLAIGIDRQKRHQPWELFI